MIFSCTYTYRELWYRLYHCAYPYSITALPLLEPLFVCPPDALHYLELSLEAVAVLGQLVELLQEVVENTAREYIASCLPETMDFKQQKALVFI